MFGKDKKITTSYKAPLLFYYVQEAQWDDAPYYFKENLQFLLNFKYDGKIRFW